MLDIKFMRENRDAVLAAMRPWPPWMRRWRRRWRWTSGGGRSWSVELLRAERNSGSKQIGQLMREGKRAEGQALQARMRPSVTRSRRWTRSWRRWNGLRCDAAHPEPAAPQRAGR